MPGMCIYIIVRHEYEYQLQVGGGGGVGLELERATNGSELNAQHMCGTYDIVSFVT